MLQYWASVTSYIHSLLLLWLFMLVPGGKKENNSKETTSRPVARNAEETQTASGRILPVLQRAMPQVSALGCSTKAPSQDWLCDTDTCYCPEPSRQSHERTLRASCPGEAQPRTHVCAAGLTILVRGKLSTNLPAVLNYLNVSKLSTFNVHKYILLQNIVVYRPTTNIYMYVFVYIHTSMCVYVCVCIYMHTNTNVYICFLSILET